MHFTPLDHCTLMHCAYRLRGARRLGITVIETNQATLVKFLVEASRRLLSALTALSDTETMRFYAPYGTVRCYRQTYSFPAGPRAPNGGSRAR